MQLFDPQEIRRALRVWFQPGDIFEVRILDAITGSYNRPHVESGYFDSDHIEQLPEILAADLRGYRGIYITVNPPRAELLARAANRLRNVRQEPITADRDVDRRRWLLIDCDAVRASGISSSNAEHQAALTRAGRIREDLGSAGWPDPVMLDSGNGAQLMYRVDLPADDGGLLQQVIAGLSAAYSDAAVEIDLTVFNPARIWRLPGTMNCKGDPIPDREHRMARIISSPAMPAVVDRNLLEAYRANLPGPASRPLSPGGHPADQTQAPDISAIAGPPVPLQDAFQIDDWIRKYAPELQEPLTWQNGRRWIFPVCPFNDAHRNRSAVLIQQASGAVAFTCHHNGCRGNDWTKLRELREPGFASRVSDTHLEPLPEFYGGTIAAKPAVPAATEPPPPAAGSSGKSSRPLLRHVDPGPLTDDLLQIPGFIHQVMEYDLATAPYPNRVLAFAGALALTSFLTSRKYRDSANNMPNIYLIALASSGTGKDHPRKVNVEIAYTVGMAGQIGDAFASGEGIEDAMMLNKAMLFQTDEIDGLFNSINKAKDGRNEMIMNVLLKMYSSSNSVYTARAKAANRNGGIAKRGETVVDKPGLTLFGTAVPKFLYESLNGRMLENGFFARSLILEADTRGRGRESEYAPPPDIIIDTAKYWAGFTPLAAGAAGSGNLFEEHPEPHVVRYADGVLDIYDHFRAYADDRYADYENTGDLTATALWGRTFEKTRKLALLYALSEDPQDPVITAAAANWAWNFSTYQTRRQLFMAESYVADNPFHQACLKFNRILNDAGGSMDKSTMIRRMHLKVTDLDQIEEYLRDAGELEVQMQSTDGKRVKKVYVRTS